jgi:2-amino-4-hydroxy-6-hydroxymethyldihydropteridine diphosphokinase
MVDVYIALGSNLGDRKGNLQRAEAGLSGYMQIRARSTVLETAAQYLEAQPDFLNMVLMSRTEIAAIDLLQRLQSLERRLGRVPSVRFGPRAIDIDILYYGDEIIDRPNLQVPHPRLHERLFVLQPLMEIAADFRHPQIEKTTREMIETLNSRLREVTGTKCRD